MSAVTQPQPVPGAPPAAVLFIDDHPEGKGLYREYLEFCGFRVTIATGLNLADGAVACPDVIVIDLAMPRTDAIATIRQLKAHPASARIPVVALAGVSDEPTTALARAAGADVCLVKPCVPSQVGRAIQTLLVWQRSRPSV